MVTHYHVTGVGVTAPGLMVSVIVAMAEVAVTYHGDVVGMAVAGDYHVWPQMHHH